MRLTRRHFLQGTLLFSASPLVHATSPWTTVSHVEQIKTLSLHAGQLIYAQGYYYPEKASALFYQVVTTRQHTPMAPHAIIINHKFHIVPQYKETLSFKQLGFKLDGITDETALLRRVLQHKGHYLFDAGTLIVSDFVELDSDITLTGQGQDVSVIEYRSEKNNWLFINGKKGDRGFLKTPGYTGRGNYLFKDFTINLRGDLAIGSRSAFIFGRSQNIKLSHLKLINGKNSHRIECNSSQNVLIEHCIFSDTLITDNKAHEEINIDFNTPKGFPAYGEWDYSACQNVVIKNCQFARVQTGIACHSQSENKHRNVYIDSCLFNETASSPIKLLCFEESYLSNLAFIHSRKPLIIISSTKISLHNIIDKNGRKPVVKNSTDIEWTH